jgi:hypothetical protein
MSDAAMPIATDPLGAIRMELVSAARRRTMARRRAKRVSTTTAVGFATLAMAAGATAVMDVSTGVPAIDKVLQVHKDEAVRSEGALGRPTLGDLQVAEVDNAVSPSLQVPWGAGSAVGVNYLSRDGELCLALAMTDGEGVSGARGQATGCTAPGAVSQRLADQASFVSGLTVGETLIVNGYANEDLASLSVRGPSGPLEVRLSDVWSPETDGGGPMRVFLAFGPVDANGDGRRDVKDVALLTDPAVYTVEAKLKDGRTVRSGP